MLCLIRLVTCTQRLLSLVLTCPAAQANIRQLFM